ncbi:Glutamate--tRNA ligase [Posidoniimonas polymericola]|uniref:Glutamate--tRNA ligase n=1 Tax=Posidoniimonas polymericola TaxID=2528002 RepID=A0A5C5YI58_9BACT|nr:tRNA glutamyl-Q(34) synthetase GluQRS [Posidoniimonas polymericola]TWT74422.1 Glutamate--tRNA ligase [Posidoniimonas polymericola]
MPRTRLAPSPTGALHLGNVRTFLVNWAMARQGGWEVVLRIEDLDGPRIKEQAARGVIDTLAWLGIDWDDGPHYQTADLAPYHAALDRLAKRGEIYPCRCSRSQIAEDAASAPHGDQHELRYTGRCRPASPAPLDGWSPADGAAWRLRVPEGKQHFVDQFCGPQSLSTDQTVGDFLVSTKAGTPSYQLAVVVDDARQGVDQIVRGDDLLTSTPRQELLYERLELGPPPTWTHLPLVVGPDGRRLAKRHGDTRVDSYRQEGVRPERVVGLIASWSGLAMREELSVAEFAAAFDLARLPRDRVTFTAEDDAWLLEQSS